MRITKLLRYTPPSLKFLSCGLALIKLFETKLCWGFPCWLRCFLLLWGLLILFLLWLLRRLFFLNGRRLFFLNRKRLFFLNLFYWLSLLWLFCLYITLSFLGCNFLFGFFYFFLIKISYLIKKKIKFLRLRWLFNFLN